MEPYQDTYVLRFSLSDVGIYFDATTLENTWVLGLEPQDELIELVMTFEESVGAARVGALVADGLSQIGDDATLLAAAQADLAIPVPVDEASFSALTLGKQVTGGIKVDQAAPTYGWRDILGPVNPKATGAGSPNRRLYAGGNIYDWSFTTNDVADCSFHLPHDYVPGTELFVHVHWSHNGTAITGTAAFAFYAQYAKGYDQAIFSAEVTAPISYATTDIATTPRYQHRIDEVALTVSGGDGAHLDTDDIEPDGMILAQIKLTTLPTITAGYLFLHTVDLHYQSSNLATKNKAPAFWT